MKAYLIPGSGEDINSRDYRAVLKAYEEAGYEPVFVPINWRYRTIDDWVKEVETQILDSDLQDSLLSGFSFGAMIAFAVAARTNPKRLLLFSLSPYFQEDMPLPPRYVAWAGKRRIEAFKRLSFNKLAKQIHCPTNLFLGSIEKEKYGGKRTTEAHKQIANTTMTIVEKAAHDVANPNYIAAINKVLN